MGGQKKTVKGPTTEEEKEENTVLKEEYRRKTKNIPNEDDGIIIRNQVIPEDFSREPQVYGGVEITEKEKEILSLPPKSAI